MHTDEVAQSDTLTILLLLIIFFSASSNSFSFDFQSENYVNSIQFDYSYVTIKA